MTRHFAVETDSYIWDGYQPACGNDFRHVKKLTDTESKVTCARCRELSGFDEQLTDVEVGIAPDNGNARIAA